MRPRRRRLLCGDEAPRLALALGLAALLAGCGANTRTVTITRSAPRRVAVHHATTETRPPSTQAAALAGVPESVIARAEDSVVDAGCSATGQDGIQTAMLGTAFAIVPGNASVFVTASHVAARCVGGSMGAGDASVAVTSDNVTRDVALLQETDAGPPVVPRALTLATGGVRPGEPVALIGYPVGPPNYPGKVGRPLVVVSGTVIATGQHATLRDDNGLIETLTDAIEVSGGIGQGSSGGPAIDATGSVVGVIEGTNGTATYLTPASAIGEESAPANGSLPALTVGSWSGIKPTRIDFSADAGNVVTGIIWSSWTATQAVGQGTSDIQSCIPNCAQGSDAPVPATITLSNPENGDFTQMKESRNGVVGTGTYGSNGWPMGAS